MFCSALYIYKHYIAAKTGKCNPCKAEDSVVVDERRMDTLSSFILTYVICLAPIASKDGI